jgi:hypothetical protein
MHAADSCIVHFREKTSSAGLWSGLRRLLSSVLLALESQQLPGMTDGLTAPLRALRLQLNRPVDALPSSDQCSGIRRGRAAVVPCCQETVLSQASTSDCWS